jgi:hypothetical protein
MELARAAFPLTLGMLLLVTPAAAGQEMALPKPGPEHQLLKQDEGTWDATVEIFAAPGQPPLKSKGVETNTLGCGGLCLISDFKGEMMPGQVFHGHGVTVYDPSKKKYVGSWTDSMSAGLMIAESTYDAASRTFTGWMEGPDMTGKVAKTKSVVEVKDAGTRIFSMYGTGPDGKEGLGMRITYQRKQ